MAEADYSILDRPELIQFVFYPRNDFIEASGNATDHFIPVEEDISISCRFHPSNKNSPNILFFHGNGEVVSDYDDIAPIYNQLDINFFIADYRGYGASGGMPNFSSMVKDAHVIFKIFKDILAQDGYEGGIFLMGRSLGGISAFELATSYPKEIKGLILESARVTILGLLKRFGLGSLPGGEELDKVNLRRLQGLSVPLLIIHGERDSLIPLNGAKEIFDIAPVKNKHLLIIPGADHNTVLWFGREKYFRAIKDFVTA